MEPIHPSKLAMRVRFPSPAPLSLNPKTRPGLYENVVKVFGSLVSSEVHTPTSLIEQRQCGPKAERHDDHQQTG
jgi:hypothetical protein